MQLNQIKNSISDLERKEALNLILAIRRSRRTVKVKVKKKLSLGGIKRKANPMKALIKGMDATNTQELLNYLESLQDE